MREKALKISEETNREVADRKERRARDKEKKEKAENRQGHIKRTSRQ